jgi:hypothetical protein
LFLILSRTHPLSTTSIRFASMGKIATETETMEVGQAMKILEEANTRAGEALTDELERAIALTVDKLEPSSYMAAVRDHPSCANAELIKSLLSKFEQLVNRNVAFASVFGAFRRSELVPPTVVVHFEPYDEQCIGSFVGLFFILGRPSTLHDVIPTSGSLHRLVDIYALLLVLWVVVDQCIPSRSLETMSITFYCYSKCARFRVLLATAAVFFSTLQSMVQSHHSIVTTMSSTFLLIVDC